MCLYSKTERAKRAKEDIICWKHLFYRKGDIFFDNYYSTPFTNYYVRHEITDGLELKPWEKTVVKRECDDGTFIIAGGMIHTFKSFSRVYANSVPYLKEDNVVGYNLDYNRLFLCIIPKGTKYYEDSDTYASEKIVFKKEILTYDDVFTYLDDFNKSSWRVPRLKYHMLDDKMYKKAVDTFIRCGAIPKKDVECGKWYVGRLYFNQTHITQNMYCNNNGEFYLGKDRTGRGVPHFEDSKEEFFVPIDSIIVDI